MKAILGMLLRPLTMTILGILILDLVIWFGGTALHARGYLPRWMGPGFLAGLCIFIVILAIGVFYWRRWTASKKAAAIEAQLRSQAREQVESMRPDLRADVEELQNQLDRAVGSLKTSKLGKGALYALPWYMIVGPPGSGKTTMLRESGLNFPDPEYGGRGLRGVGGTRNCDWWFTDQAILLDTAGRYATETEDRDEWLAFLEMVAKARKNKPINGVLIAISIEEIAGAQDHEIADHATKIRQRIDELNKELRLQFPIYIVFTKCDLLDGFAESFESLDRNERSQVWGYTVPTDTKSDEIHGTFEREFDVLYDRLCARRLSLLSVERAAGKQQKVYSFPLQLAVARDRVSEFVRQIAAPNPYHEGSQIRGFYFTSGTQEGQPIDRVLGAIRDRLGLVETAPDQSGSSVEAKSYFIGELFNDVVFADKDLARSSSNVQLRQMWLQRAALAGIVLFALFLVVRMFGSYFHNSALVDRSVAVVQGYKEVRTKYRDDDDFGKEEPDAASLERLDALRHLFVELNNDYQYDFLLGRSGELYPGIRDKYIDALRRFLLTPAARYLEREIVEFVAEQRDSDSVMQAKVLAYGMICRGLRSPIAGVLRDALIDSNAWRWTGHGQPLQATVESPLRKHLEAFVDRVCEEDPALWQLEPGAISEWRRASGIVNQDAESRIIDDAVLHGRSATTEEAAPKADDFRELDVALRDQRLREGLERAGIPVTDEALAVQRERFRVRQLEAVSDSVRNTRIQERGDVQQAARSLQSWISRRTLHETYRQALKDLRTHDPDVPAPPAPDEGVEGLDQVVVELEGFVEKLIVFNVETRGRRILARVGGTEIKLSPRVEDLRFQIRLLRERVNKEMSKLQVDTLRSPFRAAAAQLVDDIEGALAEEARDELESYWQDEVGAVLVRFAAVYPFAVTATEEVDAREFESMFRPAAGGKPAGKWDAAWSVIEDVSTKLDLTLSPTFRESRDRIATVQKATFDEKGALAVGFLVNLQKSGDSVLTVLTFSASGNKTVSTREQNQVRRNTVRIWTAADRGASLMMQTANQVAFRATEESAWGLFRLLTLGEQFPDEEDPNGLLCKIPVKARGEEKIVDLRVYPTRGVNAFKAGFFAIPFPQQLFER